MEAPAILVTGERRRSGEIEIEKVENGSSEEGRKDNCEKGKVRGKVHGEGLNVRLGREGRRKSETPQLRKKEEQAAGEAGEKAKEGQGRKRDEKTRSVGKRGEDRLATQGNKGATDEEEGGGLRSRKKGSSPHPPPSSSLLLGADLGLLRGRQGRRKSEVRLLLGLQIEQIPGH